MNSPDLKQPIGTAPATCCWGFKERAPHPAEAVGLGPDGALVGCPLLAGSGH